MAWRIWCRKYLGTVVVVLVVLAAVGVGLLAARDGRNHALVVHKQDRAALQAALASLGDEALLFTAQDISAAAARPWTLQPGSQADEQQLADVVAASPSLAQGVGIFSLEGKPLAIRAEPGTLPRPDDPGLVALRTELLGGRIGLSGVFTTTAQPEYAIGLPIMRNGKPVAVFVGAQTLRGGRLEEYVQRLKVAPKAQLFVLDAAQRVVLATNPETIGKAVPGLPRLHPRDTAAVTNVKVGGERYVASYRSLHVGQWSALALQPASVFEGPLQKDWSHVEVLFLIALFLGGVPLIVVNHKRTNALAAAAQAERDPLTRLPNRTGFRRELLARMRTAAEDDRQLAVVFVDLDRFKHINDSYGHAIGDRVLLALSERLTGAVGPRQTLARIGGDEFGVIVRTQSIDKALVVAQNLVDLLSEPIEVEGAQALVGASAGVAICDPSAPAIDALRDADMALYAAKEDGGGRARAYSNEMSVAARERLDLERDLRHALENDELELHYQPIFDMTTGRITALEALTRWTHPTRGPIGPDKFIPIAEDSDLICDLGRWVRARGFSQLAQWRAAGIDGIQLNINVSRRELRRGHDFTTDVSAGLHRAGLQTRDLVLELTENVLFEDNELVLPVLSELDMLGVRLAMDDFGTGHSTLAHLRAFPIRAIKLDKSFVHGVCTGPVDKAFVRSLVGLAHDLRLELTAEGIETERQAEVVASLGCRYGQGFHLGRPIPAASVEPLLHASATTAVIPSFIGQRQ